MLKRGSKMKRRHILKKKEIKERHIHSQIRKAAADILDSKNFQSTTQYIQHGTVTVNEHCISVAECSLMLSKILKIRCNRRELIRGALLHDYFLYDWHDKDHINPLRLHGFFHPGVALKNASAEYNLTDREKDIIRKHMWPMTIIPPMYREAWIVTVADKWVSLKETLRVVGN